jgi:hypothetical protein
LAQGATALFEENPLLATIGNIGANECLIFAVSCFMNTVMSYNSAGDQLMLANIVVPCCAF